MLKKANLKMQLKAARTAHVTRATIGAYQRPQTSLFRIDNDYVQKSTCPFQATAPFPFESGSLVSLGHKPGANHHCEVEIRMDTCESGSESSSFSSQST